MGVLEPECEADCSPSSGFEVNIITSTRPCNFHGMVLGTGIGCYRYVTLEIEWWKQELGNNFDWTGGGGVNGIKPVGIKKKNYLIKTKRKKIHRKTC
jgi:hypothetical protein